MPRPIVPAPSTATVSTVNGGPGSSVHSPCGGRGGSLSAHRDGAMSACRLLGEGAQLVGDGEGGAHGGGGELLRLRRRAEPFEQLARVLVVLDLLGADGVAVEPCRRLV